MDEIKVVINELNQPPFNKNLNLIGYDNLRSEQRLDLLIEVLNVIDPKLGLASIRTGNLDEIMATILDTLRIFQYNPPLEQFNPIEFRKNLILADKDLITSILAWLLTRLPAIKKRAYLARFLVRIELSPEVEGDHDVLVVYKQYLRLIEEFKRVHSSYESQRKSLDSVVELQRDIKSMEIEREQIKNKLEVLQRKTNFRSSGDEPHTSRVMFEAAQQYVQVKLEGDKLDRQLAEQSQKIDRLQRQIEEQQIALAEMKSINSQLVASPTTGSVLEPPEAILAQLEEEVGIRQRLARGVLPAELEETRTGVKEIQQIEAESDIEVKARLTRVQNAVHVLDGEVKNLLEAQLRGKKTSGEDEEDDHLGHYRANARLVAERKEESQKVFLELEKQMADQQAQLDRMRAQFNDGDLPLRGEALKVYIETISHQDVEMNDKTAQLEALRLELKSLEVKMAGLKKEEAKTLTTIDELEEAEGIEGYFRMKEMNLNAVVDDNDDGIEDANTDMESFDVEGLRETIDRLDQENDKIKETLMPAQKEVRLLKESETEMESDFDMKRRLYDTAAAGLETDLGRAKGELRKQKTELARLKVDKYRTETELVVAQAEKNFRLARDGQNKSVVVKALEAEIEQEEAEGEALRQREKDLKANEQYYRRQIDMWRDLKALFEVKAEVAAKRNEQSLARENDGGGGRASASSLNRLIIE